MKRIDVICNDGSPLGVSEKSIYGEDGRTGIGGAELFLLTLCRAWHDAGHRVRLYNNPNFPNGSVFPQHNIDAFRPDRPDDDRDAVIVFRSPNHRLTPKTKGLKVWLSCDQMTVGSFRAFSKKVDKIVTISQHHADHFLAAYEIEDTVIIDIPVRIWEYENVKVTRVPYRCIFNHMPDRGIMQLHAAWAKIVKEVPEASLVITSDWRLWNPAMGDNAIRQYRRLYATLPNVTYAGAINRRALIRHQLKSQLELYPSVYHELFGIATAENQVAGCYPITSKLGATETTNMGALINGDANSPEFNKKFTNTAIDLLRNQEELKEKSIEVQRLAKERFSLKKILKEWDERVFND